MLKYVVGCIDSTVVLREVTAPILLVLCFVAEWWLYILFQKTGNHQMWFPYTIKGTEKISRLK